MNVKADFFTGRTEKSSVSQHIKRLRTADREQTL